MTEDQWYYIFAGWIVLGTFLAIFFLLKGEINFHDHHQ